MDATGSSEIIVKGRVARHLPFAILVVRIFPARLSSKDHLLSMPVPSSISHPHSSNMAAHSATTPNGVHEALCSDIVAVQANNPSIVPQILEKVASFGPRPFIIDDDIRLELAQLARTLYVALKTPREMMIEDNWVQVCLRVLNDLEQSDLYISQDAMPQSLLATMLAFSKCCQIHRYTSAR